MSNRLKVILIIILVAAIAGASFAAWKWKDKSNNPTSSTGSSQNSSAAGQMLNGKYVIKDLGIEFTLPDALKGMSVTADKSPANVNPPVAVVQLHLQSYSDLANKCLGTPLSTTQSFAILSTATTVNGALPPGANSLKQFKSFYITSLGASVPANLKCQDKITQSKLASLSDQLNKSLDQALAGAQTL